MVPRANTSFVRLIDSARLRMFIFKLTKKTRTRQYMLPGSILIIPPEKKIIWKKDTFLLFFLIPNHAYYVAETGYQTGKVGP